MGLIIHDSCTEMELRHCWILPIPFRSIFRLNGRRLSSIITRFRLQALEEQ